MTPTSRCSQTTQIDAVANAVRGELPLALALGHGGEAETVLRYEVVGRDAAPVLLVAGGISAGRHAVASAAFPDKGWWQSQAASFDPGQFRLLSFDWIGADGSVDLPIDPADQAAALRLLLDHLGIARLGAFVGASYGGMVGMHFAVDFPDRVNRLVALCAAGKSHPYSSAFRSLQRRLIREAEQRGDAGSGIEAARALAVLTYRSAREFGDRFAQPPAIRDGRVEIASEAYLAAHGARHSARFGPVAYRRLSESIDLHRIDPARIGGPATLVAADTDWLVPAADVQALAAAVSDSEYHCLTSIYGHDAFLKEAAQIDAILQPILTVIKDIP
jgi:homoserine O-acetyltransferase